MDKKIAVRRLSAIAHDARLAVFRLLITAGPEGMPAGEIAQELSIPANTLSAQLLILANAQLVQARRDGRSIIYSANFDTMRDLLQFLMEDCCARSPEICAPLLSQRRVSIGRQSSGRARSKKTRTQRTDAKPVSSHK